MNYKISYKNLFFITNVIIVFSLLLLLSLGQTARWDILDHIQMADRYEKYGNIYPNFYDKYLTGASVYFPGLSLLTILLKKILPDNLLLITLQILACLFVVMFYFIQKHITKSFLQKTDNFNFFFLTSIAFLFLNYDWLIYASEFKPDIISYCIGSFGIILSGIDKNKSKFNLQFISGIVLTGVAIIFKQQFIFFLFGLIFYSLLQKDNFVRIFAFSSFLLSIILLLLFKYDHNLWFWTVKVLQDDGFVSIKSWLITHHIIAINYLIIVTIIITLYFFKQFTLPNNYQNFFFKYFRNNIWFFIMIFVFFGAFISSFKVGGNAGNTAFGLVVLLPIFLYFIQNIKTRHLLIFYTLLIFTKSPLIFSNTLRKYSDILKFSKKTTEIIKTNNLKILTGSDVYYATRNSRNSNMVVNYWMYSLKNNTDINKQLEISANELLFDYLIVENWPDNKKYFSKSKRYKILYENNIGIIATSHF
jgi:hypothetical protein